MVTKQTVQKIYESPWEKAKAYLKVMLPLGNFHITKQELDILAFIACMGDISKVPIRRACLEKFGISNSSLNNSISKLKRQGLLVKTNNQNINILPLFQINYKGDIKLEIQIGTKGPTNQENINQD